MRELCFAHNFLLFDHQEDLIRNENIKDLSKCVSKLLYTKNTFERTTYHLCMDHPPCITLTFIQYEIKAI